MGEYSIELAASARREYQSLSKNLQPRIRAEIDSLSENPRPPGVRKVQMTSGGYRIRVDDYRIIYEIDDSARRVLILHIRHRSDAYR